MTNSTGMKLHCDSMVGGALCLLLAAFAGAAGGYSLRPTEDRSGEMSPADVLHGAHVEAWRRGHGGWVETDTGHRVFVWYAEPLPRGSLSAGPDGDVPSSM